MGDYTIESSPTLGELRRLVPGLSVEVHNSVSLQEYYSLARSMHEQLQRLLVLGDQNDNRQYLELKIFLATCSAIDKHNGQGSATYAKDRLWLKREFKNLIESLETVAARIVRTENERRLHEVLFELFDAPGAVSTCGDNDGQDDYLKLEQCIQILSMDANRAPPAAAASSSSKTRPTIANFDSLRLSTPSAASLSVAAVGVKSLSLPTALYPSITSIASTAPPPRELPQSAAIPMPSAPPAPLASAPVVPIGLGTDKIILRMIAPMAFYCSAASLGLQPFTTQFELRLGEASHYFRKFDHHVSFLPFLRMLPPSLQITREALETNRCFFIHLGLAMSIHPFVLQAAFRAMTAQLLPTLPIDSPALDIIPTVTDYAGFVDANCLCYLWPAEFEQYRICIISNSSSGAAPMFSCFSSRGEAAKVDIIIHCDGSHFTLLQPLLPRNVVGFSVSQLLLEAMHARSVVQKFSCQNMGTLQTLQNSLLQL